MARRRQKISITKPLTEAQGVPVDCDFKGREQRMVAMTEAQGRGEGKAERSGKCGGAWAAGKIGNTNRLRMSPAE